MSELEKRVALLEQKVARLQKQQTSNSPTDRAWVDDVYGSFAGDDIFLQAMELGRKYRQSLRPRVRKSRAKR